ncbi:hypothetical protein [Streptomyces alkaliterrae]|uniref:Uncharacterized protein n=1 Tax=Streptomyces alkaliterrae TaxID=2213162 RepID=A0A5P0YQM1_9ACTN|nr:hypothetical protein [Streptomyces alkaliterrae]MBB1255899.1 hypothetical protein [Streptomyces alkaliterrae]MBB1260742.1 hypothetical protein [Streptomyces alkaliterrae]MQS02606.1 hypothetical protein [Streptomyces alkaliterrae]
MVTRVTGGGWPRQGRLLPWEETEGKPAYLAPGSEDSRLGRLADAVERAQLHDAAVVLTHASAVLADRDAAARELRFTAERLRECLVATTRVARSRGARLGMPPEGP